MADQHSPTTVPETGVADLGLFGKPLFQDPGARALLRMVTTLHACLERILQGYMAGSVLCELP